MDADSPGIDLRLRQGSEERRRRRRGSRAAKRASRRAARCLPGRPTCRSPASRCPLRATPGVGTVRVLHPVGTVADQHRWQTPRARIALGQDELAGHGQPSERLRSRRRHCLSRDRHSLDSPEQDPLAAGIVRDTTTRLPDVAGTPPWRFVVRSGLQPQGRTQTNNGQRSRSRRQGPGGRLIAVLNTIAADATRLR